MLVYTPIRINGVDITHMIVEGGVKWSRNDIDGANAGRTLSGVMIRDVVATKVRLDITCLPLSENDHSTLLRLLANTFVSVTYKDPLYGIVTKTMYSNNHSSTLTRMGGEDENEELWDEISFPLIER